MVFKRVLYDHKTAYPDDYITVVSATGVTQRLYLRIGVDNINDFKMRIKEADKAFAHGSYACGDGKVESRKIKFSCHIRGRDQIDHDRQYNELISLLAQRDYSLRLARLDREYHIAGLLETKQKWIKGFKWLWSDVDITLMMSDPFTYATNQILIQREFTTEQQETEINFQNPSSVDVPLILTFKPLKGATANSIMLVHSQTGKSMQLRDTLLTSPAVSVVNAETGTVYRDMSNSLNTFSGIFLHAVPGTNTLKYTGSPCNIEIAFTARWFV